MVPESGPHALRGLHIASRPAADGRPGRRQMHEAPASQTPARPAAQEKRGQQTARAQRGHPSTTAPRISAKSKEIAGEKLQDPAGGHIATTQATLISTSMLPRDIFEYGQV